MQLIIRKMIAEATKQGKDISDIRKQEHELDKMKVKKENTDNKKKGKRRRTKTPAAKSVTFHSEELDANERTAAAATTGAGGRTRSLTTVTWTERVAAL